MSTVITEKELSVRKSHGTVYLCKSCKDLRGKLVLVEYHEGERHDILYSFCPDCMKFMVGCPTCREKK